MFQRLSMGGSHRQRLELHSAMVAMEVSAAPPSAHSPSPSPSMAVESPVPTARRMSLQLDDLERPMHRNSAFNGQDVFGRPSGQSTVQPAAAFDYSASAARTQTTAAPPAAAAVAAAPGATDWACLYAPHNDPTRRRRSLDCIRSARKSDRSAAAATIVDDDASSVHARSQAAKAAKGAGGSGSDSEEEVCSNRAERRGTAPAAQALRQPRNVFREQYEGAWHAGQVSGDIASRAQAGAARRGGGLVNEFAMDVDGGEEWGGVEQALHPAGLMQARAAMVAQGGGMGGAPQHAVEAGSDGGDGPQRGRKGAMYPAPPCRPLSLSLPDLHIQLQK